MARQPKRFNYDMKRLKKKFIMLCFCYGSIIYHNQCLAIKSLLAINYFRIHFMKLLRLSCVNIVGVKCGKIWITLTYTSLILLSISDLFNSVLRADDLLWSKYTTIKQPIHILLSFFLSSSLFINSFSSSLDFSKLIYFLFSS